MKTLRPSPEVELATGRDDAVVRMVEVDGEYQGQRLDNFLSRVCRGVPRSHVYQLIRSGQVRVNGGRASADLRLEAGDRVRVPPVSGIRSRELGPQSVSTGDGEGPSLSVLHEDELLLVIDKPSGLAVHGGSGVSLGAIEALRRQRPQCRFLELAHRLDRDTSGVLVLAKRRSALVAIQEQFRTRTTGKTYLAVAAGRWPLRTRSIQAPLERLPAPDGDRRVRVSASGRDALTRVTGLRHFELPAGLGIATLVLVQIETGRTHQIRVHLAHAGHPVVGDDKYGDFALNRGLRGGGLRRMYLHAFRLKLFHPVSGQTLSLEAPLPTPFGRLMGLPEGIEEILAHPMLQRRPEPA